MVVSLFKSPPFPIQEKGRRVPIHIQAKIGAEIKNLIREGDIVKLYTCTIRRSSSHHIKKDGTMKLAMNTKPMKSQIYRNKLQMSSLLEMLVSAAQIITSKSEGTVWFTSLDLKHAFSQYQ